MLLVKPCDTYWHIVISLGLSDCHKVLGPARYKLILEQKAKSLRCLYFSCSSLNKVIIIILKCFTESREGELFSIYTYCPVVAATAAKATLGHTDRSVAATTASSSLWPPATLSHTPFAWLPELFITGPTSLSFWDLTRSGTMAVRL